jgi:DNA invertase Pin-like site-specific DNA recombinase
LGDDQVRVCRERIQQDGHQMVQAYTDRAISGASLGRSGIQSLMVDAANHKFDLVYAEALDRISRDQEDVAGVYKRLRFADVRIITLAEGEISELHVGLKGTMNALFLTEVANKTRRGLRGRVEVGRSGGGVTYGYDVLRTQRPDGTVDAGNRRINDAEAETVRRIFREYAAGRSPRAIAVGLNGDAVAGPRGRGWGASTINGNHGRGTGVLNNRIYVGKLVWNKLRYMKDPDTGKRRSKLNKADAVIEKDVPHLRIVEQDLWDAVKQRQEEVMLGPQQVKTKPWDRRRPRYLLSGLAKCGACGGGYVQISKTHLGCAAARNKGTCQNRLGISREALEKTILNGLKQHLMQPELFKEFCAEFIREVNRLKQDQAGQRSALEAELARIARRNRKLVDAIVEGVPARTLKDELMALEAREDEIKSKLTTTPEPKVYLAPNMAEIYRERVEGLQQALAAGGEQARAQEAIRGLIEKVVLTPIDGLLRVDLHGEVAAILQLSVAGTKGRRELDPDREQLVMVAGARNRHYLLFNAIGLSSGIA